MYGPNPDNPYPMEGFPQVCYIKNIIKNPNIIIGDYTYYDDPDGAEKFEQNVLYHYPFIGDKLIIGKYCAIARGVKFIMNGANHKMSGFSAYPFSIFRNGWETVLPQLGELPYKGDTVIGNDVWIGYDATIMPGAHIGDGAIIAAKSLVVGRVKPYTIMGGNPATVLMQRFSDDTIRDLRRIAWWDWDREKVSRNLRAIVDGNLDNLRQAK